MQAFPSLLRVLALALASACLASPIHAATDVAGQPGLSIQTMAWRGETTNGVKAVKNDVAMPWLQAAPGASPAAQAVATRINDSLFLDRAEGPAPRKPAATFSEADGLAMTGTTSQAFSLSRNDARVLTFSIEAEGCGAYCENHTAAYSFAVQDGALLTAPNLFTTAGRKALAARMRQEQLSAYRKQLASLRQDLKAARARPAKGNAKAAQDEISDTEDRIALNEQCLAGQQAAPQRGEDAFTRFGYYRFEAADKAFTLTAGRCSNHAMRALDDVGEVTLTLAYATLEPWLTVYGKALLLGDPATAATLPPQPDGISEQVLRGTLGTTAISMQLHPSGEDISGIYFYERFRKPITLTGKLRGQQIELTEQSGDGKAVATFTLARSGNALKGMWSGGKQFPVVLGN